MKGGCLYNPEDGRDYKGSLQLRSGATLVVSGRMLVVCPSLIRRLGTVPASGVAPTSLARSSIGFAGPPTPLVHQTLVTCTLRLDRVLRQLLEAILQCLGIRFDGRLGLCRPAG
jgi:hypothetical protein